MAVVEMAKEQQQPQPQPVSETRDHQQQQMTNDDSNNNDNDEDMMMEAFSSSSRGSLCCAFLLPCFGTQTRHHPGFGSSSSSPSVWERLQQSAETEPKWWARPIRAIKKVREWSEIIAGPKWKTFIRRFNRNGRAISNAKFHYDPLSYSLNFDDGQGHNGHLAEGDGYFFPDFSSRFASVPQSCKSSMDLGRIGIPSVPHSCNSSMDLGMNGIPESP